MEGDRQRLVDAGFDGYLSKPISTKTFAAEIEAFIEKRKASRRI
jgi:CheY-like chemotaxis protein